MSSESLLFTLSNKELCKESWDGTKDPSCIFYSCKACYRVNPSNNYWILVHPNMKIIQINWKVVITSTKRFKYPSRKFESYAKL